jgi:hypothetical protein
MGDKRFIHESRLNFTIYFGENGATGEYAWLLFAELDLAGKNRKNDWFQFIQSEFSPVCQFQLARFYPITSDGIQFENHGLLDHYSIIY